jgi:hypothetical protein
MMPHVYGRLMPENLNFIITNGHLKSKINHTLANYLSIAEKASEQYCEIWNSMSKITNMYETLGDNPKQDYEIQEIFSMFKLFPENTSTTHSELLNDHSMIKDVLHSISSSNKGNNSIIKVGNMFSQITIDCMYILSLCFNEVYIYKPASSPAISSEKYVVCKDFKLMNVDYLKLVFNQILSNLKIARNDNNYNYISLYTRRINNNYMNTLIEANSVIGQQQLEAINNTITLIEQGKKKEKIEALKRQQVAKCFEWHKKFGANFCQNRQEAEV